MSLFQTGFARRPIIYLLAPLANRPVRLTGLADPVAVPNEYCAPE